MNSDLDIAHTDPACPPIGQSVDADYGFAVKLGTLEAEQEIQSALCWPSHNWASKNNGSNEMETSVVGRPSCATRDLQFAQSLLPVGAKVRRLSGSARRNNSLRTNNLEPSQGHAEIERRFSARDVHPMIYFRNARTQSSLKAVQDEILGGSPVTLFAETMCMAVVAQVLLCRPALPHGGLSDQQSTAPVNFIGANVAQSRMVDQKAAASSRRFRFADAFKRSIGQKLHEIVRSWRIRHAAKLLFDTSLSIGFGAKVAGFGMIGQFQRTFAAIHGCSPTEFRRSVGELTHFVRTAQ